MRWKAAVLGLVGLLVPAPAQADETRVMVGIEADVTFPVSSHDVDRVLVGQSLAASVLVAPTRYLAMTVRAREAILAAGPRPTTQDFGGIGRLGSLLLGVRFRPRGIAHPEEPSFASCVWAEVDAGIAMWISRWLPGFEAAIGFDLVVDAVTLGPVIRFLHAIPVSGEDGPDPFLMTVGLEILLNDAR